MSRLYKIQLTTIYKPTLAFRTIISLFQKPLTRQIYYIGSCDLEAMTVFNIQQFVSTFSEAIIFYDCLLPGLNLI
jgi:hypothetical protein